jgi:hypothetical protein
MRVDYAARDSNPTLPRSRARRRIHFSAMGKKTGQICLREKPSVSDLESSSLAGFFALIWSNLCTRHILFGLEPRGHHDWPYKGILRPGGCR